MVGEVKYLEFAEGTVVTPAPAYIFNSATSYLIFASDAAFVSAKGSAATYGDCYANSVDNLLHFFDGTRWLPIPAVRNYLNATSNPTINDDYNDGYSIGSVWVNVTTDRAFLCVDSTVGAASWLEYSKPFIGYHEIPTGPINGVNTAFTVTLLPVDGTILVLRNGIKVPASDYAFANPTITMNVAPAYGQKIEVFYITNGFSATIQAVLDFKVENRVISAGEITAKKLTLTSTPNVPTEVIVDVAGGSAQVYNVDFNIINGNELNWNGFALDGIIFAGSILRIQYYA
jgi:hypothetical protein